MSTTQNRLRTSLAVLLPCLVLGGGFAAFSFIKANPPEASKRPPQRTQVVPVEATRIKAQDYTVTLRSFGSVVARKQTTLVAQVSGMVGEVSSAFRAGASFAKGDVLLQLDDSDYKIAVRSAEAELVQANALFTEEKARGDQAAADWKKLGKRGRPGALLLRTPQRQAAQAQVQSAQAKLERAQLDLARTQITAPYDGQVLSTAVDEGRFVTTGNQLGVVFARGALDVRLPLNSAQLAHIDAATLNDGKAPVQLIGADSGELFEARLARSEGQIDVDTRQLFIVAEVDADAKLSVGQFVEAKIPGRTYKDAFVVPERLVLTEGEVLLVEEGEVKRNPVQVLFNDGEDAVVSGLSEGDVLVLTPLGSAVSGMRVSASVDGVPAEQPQEGSKMGGRRADGDTGDREGSTGGKGRKDDAQRGNKPGAAKAEGQSS